MQIHVHLIVIWNQFRYMCPPQIFKISYHKSGVNSVSFIGKELYFVIVVTALTQVIAYYEQTSHNVVWNSLTQCHKGHAGDMHSFKECKALIFVVMPAVWMRHVCVLKINYCLISNRCNIKHPFINHSNQQSWLLVSLI